MASERQIAANRRNARKSTRPRSGVGKNRSSRNAYRHDLTFGITSTAALAKLLDKLARKIAGAPRIPSCSSVPALDPSRFTLPKPFDASAAMPSQEPHRSAEAVRRVLPELRKLDRYERRAAARRERAVLDLLVEQIGQQLLVAKKPSFSPILMACETSGCHARRPPTLDTSIISRRLNA
jgi:hypothetical protein